MMPILRSFAGFVVPLLALAMLVSGCERRPPAAKEPELPRLDVRDEIGALLEGGSLAIGVTDSAIGRADTAGTGPLWSRLADFYQDRDQRPVWSRGGRLRPGAQQLLEGITRVSEVGLDPEDYLRTPLQRLFAIGERSDPRTSWLRPRTLARFDVRATYAYLRLAGDLRHGRMRGDTLDGDWARRDEEKFWKDLLQGAGRDDPRAVLTGLEPLHDGYRRLRETLAAYRAIEAAGGWPEVPPGPAIGRGARGPRVARLVQRLAAAGELPGPVADTVVDARLERAVGDFQSRNGIPRSGVVGELTRAALNVAVRERVRTMELNLERWRWLPADLGARHVMINIPAFRLDLVRGGRSERSMRVVVGKRKSPTPVFTDKLTYLELNPTWTVPVSIVFDELIPEMKGRVEHLARHGMYVVRLSGGRRDTLDAALVPWKKVTPDSFPYLVIQGAGPENPLGRIKLMCPNEYDVYLHDTPQRERFAEAVRDYSHGCVRVSGAIELADSLLGYAPTDTSRLDSLIAGGAWKRIRFPEAVPVHFLYWTAWADSSGAVSFRPDLYGLDERLDRAMRDRSQPFELNAGVSLSPFWVAARARAAEAARARAAEATRAVRPPSAASAAPE